MPETEELITEMRTRAEVLRRLGYRVRFDLSDSGESILLDASGNTTPSIEATDAEDETDTVLRLSAPDLRKLMQGKLSPMLAFSTGRLRVEGSKGVALKLASLLDED
jgi:putative sterol carrier protein